MKYVNSLLLKFSFMILALSLVSTTSFAQERGNNEPRTSPNASVSQTIGTTQVTINYGRPSVNGRQVFGELEAYGEVWRTGANESTAITFSGPVMIEGQKVEVGTYALYTIPREDEWTIIINSKLSWGTSYDESQDLLRVDVPSMDAPHREQFMIFFEEVTNSSAECVLHWNKTKVPFTISV